MRFNFTAYINMQKSRIRAEREEDIELLTSDGQTVTLYGGAHIVRDSLEILEEIDGLCGLNTAERARAARRAGRQFAAA